VSYAAVDTHDRQKLTHKAAKLDLASWQIAVYQQKNQLCTASSLQYTPGSVLVLVPVEANIIGYYGVACFLSF